MTAETPQPVCHHCRTPINAIDGKVGRSETCDKCGYDLHVCRNCKHYDPLVYNECNEPMADRVVDKEKRNFCDYFKPGTQNQGEVKDEKSEALKKLNDLFK